MARIALGLAGILPLLPALVWALTPASVVTPTSLKNTNVVVTNNPVPSATNNSFIDSATPDSVATELSGEGTVPSTPDHNSSPETHFTKMQTTTSNIILTSTEQTAQSTTTEIFTTSTVDNITNNFHNSTPSFSDLTSQAPASNATLVISPATDEAEIARLRDETTSLRIIVIVLGCVAGLNVIFSIILMVLLIAQKRKQKNSLIDSGIEMARQNIQLEDQKWPNIRRNSSRDDTDSESRVSGDETVPKRSNSLAGSSGIYLEPDPPKPEVSSFTPPANLPNNDQNTYTTNDQECEYYNENSQNNYNNENSQNNYNNESSQKDQVYNDIEDGINQAHSLSRQEDLNTYPPAGSEDAGIYSNF